MSQPRSSTAAAIWAAEGAAAYARAEYADAAAACATGETTCVDATCTACGGSGWFSLAAPYGHRDFGRLVPCRCTEQRRAARTHGVLTQQSNLSSFADKTFAQFQRSVPGVQRAVAHAQRFAQQPRGWLSLLGPTGCGKTHLAAAIAHHALAAGVATVMTVVPDLLDQLRASFERSSAVSYDTVFGAVRTVDLLVLDDMGTEQGSAWGREKLYQLLNHRYNHRLATVITSNVPLTHLDPRIVSRMHDAGLPATVLTLNARDYRRHGDSV